MRNLVKYQVPRHLGLEKAKKSEAGLWECSFGFSAATRSLVELDSEALELLEFCFQPRTQAELEEKFSADAETCSEIIQGFVEAGLLSELKERPASFERYDRHLLFYDQNQMDALATQSALSQARVALIGVGGIGNWVALNLIGLGLKEIRLIDFDVVELSNLTRQVLFSEASIDRSKVLEAAAALAPKNSQTQVSPFDAKVESPEQVMGLLEGCDFVILSADRPPEIHDWVDAACLKLGIPYVNLGYKDGLGIVGPLTIPRQTSCYQCFKPQKSQGDETFEAREGDALLRKWDARYQAPSFGPLNALVSTIGSLELIKYLSVGEEPLSVDCELSINPLTLEISHVEYSRDKNCWHCGELASGV